MAMERPSRVLVPLPSSSMITLLYSVRLPYETDRCNAYRLCLSTLCSMKAASRISAANVDTFASILSSTETRAKSEWWMGKVMNSAGTLRLDQFGDKRHKFFSCLQAADLCHDHNHGDRPYVGGFATHVTACTISTCSE